MSISNRQNGNSQTSNSQISHWQTSLRRQGITRPYTPDDVNRLRGSFHIQHTIARHGAEHLWNLLHNQAQTSAPALVAMTSNQPIQQLHAGLSDLSITREQAPADAQPS